MGYTHYFTQTRRAIGAEDWATICEDVSSIVKHAQTVRGVPLANGNGDAGTSPEITPQHIFLNGVGDASHETFCLYSSGRTETYYPGDNKFGDFCKTARKPYDIVVTACLCYLASVAETHNATSDGWAKDWTAGLEMARLALPKYANRLDYPTWLLEDERWRGPWVDLRTKRYEFRFCIDGHAYVLDTKTRGSYRFDTHLEAALWLHNNNTSRGENDIWFPQGWFGPERNARLARVQARRLGELVRLAPAFNRNIAPPARARPDEFPQFKEEDVPYSINELIAKHGSTPGA